MMIHKSIIAIALMSLTLPQTACGPNTVSEVTETEATSTELNLNSLIGTWDVSLFYDPDSPPAATELVISDVMSDGTISGTFYQSPFEFGRAIQRGDVVIISVITSDGSGPYSTSGRLYPDGRFEGQTLSTGRGFLTPWLAVKQTED